MTISSHALHESGQLQKRVADSLQYLADCSLCPHECGVNRLQGEQGKCSTGRYAQVGSFSPHFGEEPPLVGSNGSGTIFFSHCNLLCRFCQNYDLSRGESSTTSVDKNDLASIMLALQNQGCHNINFVSPTHVLPQILEALPLAIEGGLTVPLVYNCNGYERIRSLQLLNGIVDIYMPDFKFWSAASAKRYTNAADYPEKAREAHLEMYRQVGDLQLDTQGVGVKGLLIRHLVMPGGLDETREILHFIARKLSPTTYTNIMDQYHPCGEAYTLPPLNRRLSNQEYQETLVMAKEAGLTNLDTSGLSAVLRKLGISFE